MRTTPKLLLGALLALSCSMMTSVAHADVRTEARRHFRAGMELIQAGQLDEGVEELQEAYDILPHPNVLYNIGRAYAEAGRYEEALEYFEQYMASDPPDREEVRGFIDAIQVRLGGATETTDTPAQTDVEVSDTTMQASSEEIQAIEDAATQIETLAEATNSPALRERAVRLRALAASLRNPDAPGETDPGETDPGETDPGETDPGETAPGGSGLDELGEERSGVFDEQVISASRFAESPIDAPNSTTTITAQDIRLSGQTLLGEILRRAAGMSVSSNTPSHTDVNIRGFNARLSNKTLVLINGRTARLDFLGSTFINFLPVNLRDIERIEIIRGPAAAVYGADAFSGIINIILREPADSESYVAMFGGNAGQIGAAASVAGTEGRVAYRIGGGYQRANNYEVFFPGGRADYTPAAEDSRVGLEGIRFNADLRIALGEDNDYLISAGTAQTLVPIAPFQGRGRQREFFGEDTLVGQTYLQFNTPQGIQLRGYWNNLNATADRGDQYPGAISIPGDINANVMDVELSYSRRFHFLVDHNVSLGAGYRFKTINWNWGEDQTEHHFNFYVQDALTLHEKLRLTLSARVDRHPLLGVRFSPRGALVARITDGSSIRATVGTAFRSPSFIESYLSLPQSTPARGITAAGVGSRDLDPERMLSFELGYSNQDSDFFALEVNAYVNIVEDLIDINRAEVRTISERSYDEPNAAFNLGDAFFANQQGRFRQIGGELGVRVFPVDGLDVYANYAINDTTPLDTAPVGLELFFEEQRTALHKVNLGVQYRSPIGLDISVDLSWVGSQRWAEQVDDPEVGFRYALFEQDAYTLLNARLGWRFLEDQLEIAVSGTNLLFQEFRSHPLGQRRDTRVLGHVDVRF